MAAEILSKKAAQLHYEVAPLRLFGYWFIFGIVPTDMSLSFRQYSILPELNPISEKAIFSRYWECCSPLIFKPWRFLNIIGIELLSVDDNIVIPFCFMLSKLGVIIIRELWPLPWMAEVGLNLCSLSFGYHLLVGVDDVGNLLGIFADVIGKGSAL